MFQSNGGKLSKPEVGCSRFLVFQGDICILLGAAKCSCDYSTGCALGRGEATPSGCHDKMSQHKMQPKRDQDYPTSKHQSLVTETKACWLPNASAPDLQLITFSCLELCPILRLLQMSTAVHLPHDCDSITVQLGQVCPCRASLRLTSVFIQLPCFLVT